MTETEKLVERMGKAVQSAHAAIAALQDENRKLKLNEDMYRATITSLKEENRKQKQLTDENKAVITSLESEKLKLQKDLEKMIAANKAKALTKKSSNSSR